MTTNLHIIREAVIKAQHEKEWETRLVRLPTDQNGYSEIEDIRLADVLLALQQTPKTSKLVVDDYGVFWDLNTLSNSTVQQKPFNWNLKNDDLTAQSPECLQFLAELLSNK